jgi:hypothetical protein
MTPRELGLYGFRLTLSDGLQPADLGLVERDAPAVGVELIDACRLEDLHRVEQDRVALGWRQGSGFEVRREPPEISIESPEVAITEAIVHPLLTPPLSILSRWRGDLSLHAGGFYHAGVAWGVIGQKESGKSTTLALLADRQVPLLADDLLVLDGDVVRAGPSCVDLRPDAAEKVPGARLLGEVAGRQRHRLSAEKGPPRSPLGGLFVLAWSDRPEVYIEPVSVGEGMRILYEQEHMEVKGIGDVGRILDLLGKPIWQVSRPRDWAASAEVVERILEKTMGAG